MMPRGSSGSRSSENVHASYIRMPSGNIIDLLKRSMELEDKRGKKVKAPPIAAALAEGQD
jgi:hypothetical protein